MPRALLCLSLLFAACASMSRVQGPMEPAANGPGGGSNNTTVPAAPPASPAAPPAGARLPGQRESTSGGTSPAPAAPPILGGGSAPDRGADADLDAARAQFERGDQPGARAALEAFVSRHPGHPGRSTASLLLARLALARGDAVTARKLLDPLTAPTPDAAAGAGASVSTSARYYLGLAELRLGNHARALVLLAPFAPRGGHDASVGAPPGDDAAVELRGALAEATAPSDPIAALELWEGYVRVAREHEKAWARGRATEVSNRVAPETAWRAYGAAPASGLTRAVLGAKAAAYLRARGDAAGAASIEGQTDVARHAMGFDGAAGRVGPGDPTRIGLSIPLSGKFQVVGEAVLRAAMLAAGAPGEAPGGTQLILRDTATDADRAAHGVAELTRAEAVIGIVGAASAKAGNSAIAQATQDGIAMMALEDAAPGALTTAFQIVHAPEARAAALARQALKLGVRRFAIVGPDSVSGKRLREAFRKAVVQGGGAIVAESSYVAGATSFAAALAPLRKTAVQSIFVPDSAERLPLIAPALAVADMWPQPWGKPRPPAAAAAAAGGSGAAAGAPRSVLLLSTANELSQKLIATAGRYVQGALLCPGFFADADDPGARGFVEAYRAAYGQDPHATEAYAYDAVATLRAITHRGARTRPDVVKALAVGGGVPVLQGLTGNVTFGPDHGRVDNPPVYVIDGDQIHAVP